MFIRIFIYLSVLLLPLAAQAEANYSYTPNYNYTNIKEEPCNSADDIKYTSSNSSKTTYKDYGNNYNRTSTKIDPDYGDGKIGTKTISNAHNDLTKKVSELETKIEKMEEEIEKLKRVK